MPIEHLFNQLARHRRLRRTSDGQGGQTEALTEFPEVHLRIRPLSSSERKQADQEEGRVTHRAYLPISAQVERGDELVCSPTRCLRVVNVLEPSELGHHLEADCEERVAGL